MASSSISLNALSNFTCCDGPCLRRARMATVESDCAERARSGKGTTGWDRPEGRKEKRRFRAGSHGQVQFSHGTVHGRVRAVKGRLGLVWWPNEAEEVRDG
eukprot:1892642-Pleurochrysis_carterae.AAC.2